MPIISNFPTGGSVPDDIVTVEGGGSMEIADTLGDGPYTFEFDEEETGSGTPGKGAYEAAVKGGYAGTEEEFNQMIGSGPWVTSEEAEDLPYVKMAGDTMTGSLTVNNENGLASVNPGSFTLAAAGKDARMSIAATDTGLELCSDDGIVLLYDKDGLAVRLSGVGDPRGLTDAVNVRVLTTKLNEVSEKLQSLINVATNTANEAKEAVADGPFLPLSGGTMNGDIALKPTSILKTDFSSAPHPTFRLIDGTPTFGFLSRMELIQEATPLQGIATPTYSTDAANKLLELTDSGGLKTTFDTTLFTSTNADEYVTFIMVKQVATGTVYGFNPMLKLTYNKSAGNLRTDLIGTLTGYSSARLLMYKQG